MNQFQEDLNRGAESGDVEIDMSRIFQSLLHFAWLLAVFAMVAGIIMFGYAKLFVPAEYTSGVSMYIYSSATNVDPDTGVAFNTQISGTTVTYLQNTYKRTATADSTLSVVIENLDLEDDLSIKELKDSIKVSTTEYPYLDIKVTTEDPELSAVIANELSEVLSDQVEKIVTGSALKLVDDAKTGTKTSTSALKMTLIGAFVGFGLGCIVVILLELLNNKIYNNEYLTQTYGIPVLASISDADALSGKGFKYYRRKKYYRSYKA